MSIKYLLLNYFSNNFFVDNGVGSTYDEKTESTINRMPDKDAILDVCNDLDEWYNQNKDTIDGVFKSQGISSKSLDSFSISYNSTYTQNVLDLLPFWLRLKLEALGILDLSSVRSIGGFLY